MIVGRVIGWILVLASIIMASGEAVMALGSVDYHGLAAADLWTLLMGKSPGAMDGYMAGDSWGLLISLGLGMPAWTILGPLGIFMAHIFRDKQSNSRMLKTSSIAN